MPTFSANDKRQRRTQAERSAEMQIKILEATLKCIDSLGLHNASTYEIAREAGISRGALIHHYPTRSDLLKAAFGKVLDDELEMLSQFSQNVKPDGSSVGLIVEYLWQRYRGLLFNITVDYLSFARIDDETLKNVISEATRFNKKLDDVWDMSLAEVHVSIENRRSLMNQTLYLIRGMALQRIWRDDDIYFNKMLQEWTEFLMKQFNITSK